MKTLTKCYYLRLIGLAAVGWLCNDGLITTVEAVAGRPATPVSYAGVARRSTVGVGAPGVGVTPGRGVGTPGVGAGAPGVGVTPGPGVGTPTNKGGPVNRVGRR